MILQKWRDGIEVNEELALDVTTKPILCECGNQARIPRVVLFHCQDKNIRCMACGQHGTMRLVADS